MTKLMLQVSLRDLTSLSFSLLNKYQMNRQISDLRGTSMGNKPITEQIT